MSWRFGIVNSRLAEVYFERKSNRIVFKGHCYVEESEYKTKREKKWIKEDTKKLKLIYRKKKYKLI